VLLTKLKRLTPYRIKDAIRPPWPEAARRYVNGSFSQVGEDRIVRFLFHAIEVEHPSYIDIGAHHPFFISNTALLHLGGSRGINVEPDQRGIELFHKHRPGDVNLGVGVADRAGEMTYYRMTEPALSSFSKEAAEAAEIESRGEYKIDSVITVPVRTVADILTEHWDGECPDFMSLDVEGLDLQILKTMPSWPDRPSMICVETVTYSGRRRNEKLPEIAAYLRTQEFEAFGDTFLNTIFLRTDRWQPAD
jgi:FkbM family methyltransferase